MAQVIDNHQHERNVFVHVNVDVVDEIEAYDLKTATVRLFDIFDSKHGISARDEQLAERLLQRFPNAAQTFADVGVLLLHLACRNGASDTLIRALLMAWPDAVSTRSRYRHGKSGEVMAFLPLHAACFFPTSLKLTTLQLLVEAWPMSLQKYYRSPDGGRLLPLHLCLGNDSASLEIIQYMLRQWPESSIFPIWKGQDFVALHYACIRRKVSPTIIQYVACVMQKNKQQQKA